MAFSMAINILTLASPLYMMQVFDRVLTSRSIDTLVMLTLVVMLAIGVLTLIETIRTQMLARIGHWLDDRLGPVVFSGALKAALRCEAAPAAQGLRDLATLRGFLTGPGVAPLLDAPWAPIFIIALFALHPVFGLIGLCSAILLFTLALINEFATKRPLREANVGQSRTQQRAEAALRNAEVIRAMGMREGVIRLWRSRHRRYHGIGGKRRAAWRGDHGCIEILASLRADADPRRRRVARHRPRGEPRARCSPACSYSAARWRRSRTPSVRGNRWCGARLARRRLGELVELVPDMAPGMELPRPQGELSVDRLVFVPPGGDEPTLRGVSFALAPGEVLGVIGPSAAGKSTLARLIAGTWLPTAGKVRLDGADISVWHDSAGSHHIGYLPQDIELFAGSVRANIARLGHAGPAAVIEAARIVGLHESIMRLPRGYDSEIGESGLKLSGGQRQRIGLARAIFGRPRLVVLDEPNASLDHEGEEALHRAIVALKQCGTTIVMVAHRPSVLGLADKLLVLRQGMVEAYGSRADIIAKLNHAASVRRPAVPLHPPQAQPQPQPQRA